MRFCGGLAYLIVHAHGANRNLVPEIYIIKCWGFSSISRFRKFNCTFSPKKELKRKTEHFPKKKELKRKTAHFPGDTKLVSFSSRCVWSLVVFPVWIVHGICDFGWCFGLRWCVFVCVVIRCIAWIFLLPRSQMHTHARCMHRFHAGWPFLAAWGPQFVGGTICTLPELTQILCFSDTTYETQFLSFYCRSSFVACLVWSGHLMDAAVTNFGMRSWQRETLNQHLNYTFFTVGYCSTHNFRLLTLLAVTVLHFYS